MNLNVAQDKSEEELLEAVQNLRALVWFLLHLV